MGHPGQLGLGGELLELLGV